MRRIGWFITGLGMGALVGVVYAPSAGDQTRGELLANAKDAKEKGASLSKLAIAKTGEYVQQGKEAAGQYLEQGKTLASAHLTHASAALEAGKKAYAESASRTSSSETSPMGSSSPELGV